MFGGKGRVALPTYLADRLGRAAVKLLYLPSIMSEATTNEPDAHSPFLCELFRRMPPEAGDRVLASVIPRNLRTGSS